eukprot:8158429-Pyramimonas_sp.AAC.1
MRNAAADDEEVVRGAVARGDGRGDDAAPNDVEPSSVGEHLRRDVPVACDHPWARQRTQQRGSLGKDVQVGLRDALAVEQPDAAQVDAAFQDRAQMGRLQAMVHAI